MFMRPNRVCGLLCVFVSALLLASSASAQSQRRVYTDKQKKELAEIAAKPEVIRQIEDAWSHERREDMEFAFRVNSAGSGADWRSNPEWFNVWSKFGRLYDNPILVNYVNSLGQRLVPADSPNRYAFRLLLDPTPRAESLSTGTIYVSTGLVAMMDTEAQLAYVLAHEIAHIERNHQYNTLRSTILETHLKDKPPSLLKRGIVGVGGALAGGLLGGAEGAVIGALAGAITGNLLTRNRFEPTEWDAIDENEADQRALELILDQSFDATLVPRMYARLNGLTTRDARAGLGFIGNKVRIEQRTVHVQNQLAGPLKPRLDKLQSTGGAVDSNAGFQQLMADLKRDNGIIAMDYDLLPMAQENLDDAVKGRPDDPRAQYYLGKLYSMTGRSPEEKQKAVDAFLAAIKSDAGRKSYPDPRLDYALHLIAQDNAKTPAMQEQIRNTLKEYVLVYQRQHAGALPENMHVIYDYLLTAGDPGWSLAPGTVVVTVPDSVNPPQQTVTVAQTPTPPAKEPPVTQPPAGRRK